MWKEEKGRNSNDAIITQQFENQQSSNEKVNYRVYYRSRLVGPFITKRQAAHLPPNPAIRYGQFLRDGSHQLTTKLKNLKHRSVILLGEASLIKVINPNSFNFENISIIGSRKAIHGFLFLIKAEWQTKLLFPEKKEKRIRNGKNIKFPWLMVNI